MIDLDNFVRAQKLAWVKYHVKPILERSFDGLG